MAKNLAKRYRIIINKSPQFRQIVFSHNFNANFKMKLINRQEIIDRRKQKRIRTQTIQQKRPAFHQCVDKQLRNVSDQTVDHLIKIAQKNRSLSQEDKLDILYVIAAKTGLHLNKNTILDQISLKEYPHVSQLSANWDKCRRSYFVLKGSLLLYEQRASQNKEKLYSQTTLKTYKNLYDNEESDYTSHQEFEKYHSDYILVEQLSTFRGIGVVFKKSSLEVPRRQKLIAINAILVSFQEINKNMEFIFHDGITDEGKTQILYQFPVLQVFGRKIKNFVRFFNVKNFSLNQTIYKIGDISKAVYFIIKGEVKFEYELLLQHTEGNRYEAPFIMSTQTIGQSSYFGQQQILLKIKRTQTAKAFTSKCVVLQFIAEKFQKLMENPDFSSMIVRTAMEKKQARQNKILKTKDMFQDQTKNKIKTSGIMKKDVLKLPTEPLYISKDSKRVHNHNDSHQKINWMHGHIIKKQLPASVNKQEKKSKPFSMIQVNPDMYEATRKKYRKYSTKTVESEPDRAWTQKDIWKALKLDKVLREEQVTISAPEGRTFYDCSRRLQNQLKETRSLRPKTASSSYKTKLQYLAYLQHFSN